jgi:NADH:ubiquinone oxidoreductase subunit 6 (subunit J)
MTEKKFKLIQWMLYALMAVSALLTILFYINPASPDVLLYWGYILVIVSGVVILGVSLVGILQSPKASIKMLFVVAAIILLGIISYVVSQNTLTPAELERYAITANGVRWVGAGLVLTYMIGLVAIGVFIYTSLSRFIK